MKLPLLTIACGFVGLSHAVPTTPFEANSPYHLGTESNEIHQLFGEENLIKHYPAYVLYKRQFKKSNENGGEELQRFLTYARNVKKINEHNERYERGEVTYKLGINHLTDALPHELKRMRGYNHKDALTKPKNYVNLELDPGTLPKHVDWRKKGYVTPVKNQGHCGSCWAFSATGALEGQHLRRAGQLVSLSEQNLVDCDGESNGCDGGVMDSAFMYVKQNGGIDTENSYPYEGVNDFCRYKNATIGANATGKVDLPLNEELLAKVVSTVGPVSAALDASQWGFATYNDGIYSDPFCTNHLDHAVLLVGYGTKDVRKGNHTTKVDYWIVKNSWGTQWGKKGYFLIERGKNMCGIGSMASYPLI